MLALVAADRRRDRHRAHGTCTRTAARCACTRPSATLLLVALALTTVRLVLQMPISILPARIGADVQARLRRDLLHAFTRASWEVQSSDREGHLQETMTSQVIQATAGAVQATTLLTSLITFVVLLVSALVLNLVAAAIVLVVGGGAVRAAAAAERARRPPRARALARAAGVRRRDRRGDPGGGGDAGVRRRWPPSASASGG